MVGTWAPSSCDPLAGKTTLIKALTGDAAVQPRDQLFATLDVTAHAGSLPSRMAVIYMDTIGFLSQLPHSLIESFSATLEDVAHSVSRVGPGPSHFKYQPAGAWRPHHHTTRDGGGGPLIATPHGGRAWSSQHSPWGPGPLTGAITRAESSSTTPGSRRLLFSKVNANQKEFPFGMLGALDRGMKERQ